MQVRKTFIHGALFVLIMVTAVDLHAESPVLVEIAGVEARGGMLYVSLFDSRESFRKKVPCAALSAEPLAETVTVTFDLAPGEYLFSVYQDSNGNDRLDSGLIGIPKEPVGLSNYDGKSAPGGFERHKVRLTGNGDAVTVRMVRF